jgi:hypothetical protein
MRDKSILPRVSVGVLSETAMLSEVANAMDM